MSVLLPLPVRVALSSSVVGFSGSRSVVPPVLPSLFPLVGGSVFVGCASGVDAVVRGAFPSASVFRASSRSPRALVARSVGFVRALSSVGGVLLSFPSGSCPSCVVPSSSWCGGGGSGSWASLALALGSGVFCLVWLPSGVVPPASFGLCRASLGSGGAWWVSLPF